MLQVPVCSESELLATGYRKLSVVALAPPKTKATSLLGRDPARVAVMTQLSEHYRCDWSKLEVVCAPVAMTPDGFLFIKDE